MAAITETIVIAGADAQCADCDISDWSSTVSAVLLITGASLFNELVGFRLDFASLCGATLRRDILRINGCFGLKSRIMWYICGVISVSRHVLPHQTIGAPSLSADRRERARRRQDQAECSVYARPG